MAAWSRPDDPTIYGITDIDMSRSLAYLEGERERTGLHLTVTHLVARAVAYAISRVPEANVSVRWGRPVSRGSIDIFIQVVSEDGRDLSGFLVKNADRKTVSRIGAELQEKAVEIREKRSKDFKGAFRLARWIPRIILRMILRLVDWIGHDLRWDLPSLGLPADPFGSGMVSSVGMMGVDIGLAPVFPLSRAPVLVVVGAVRDRPWVVEGEVVVRPVMPMSATFDHRLVDGYQTAALGRAAREYLEDPVAAERKMEGAGSGT